MTQESPEPAPPGIMTRSDPPDHTRYRRLLTGQFTVRRMKLLEPEIKRIVEEHLDAMEQAGPGAELVRTFALPIPSLVICDLLGVPHADRALFQRDTATMFDFTTPLDIRAGEVVTISLPAANRDSARFDHPDQLDITHSATGHLAFGHGIHQCLGQQLARVEMRIAYPALFQRFPTLRLAVAAAEVPLRENTLIYGVHELPVTWSPTEAFPARR